LSQRSIQSPQPQVEQPQQSSPQPEQPTTTVTRYGRVVRPPGAWWEVQQQQTAEPEPATSGPMVLTDSTGVEVPIASDGELDELLDNAFTAVLSALEPQTFRQAQRSSNWDEWKVSMEEEMDSILENDVWEVVDRPANRKIVDGKWVYKLKHLSDGTLERFKARYCAKGYSQEQGIDFDEIFSPVVRYDSLRLLLAIAASKGWTPQQLDIKTAFLYGILKEEVYMHLPEGYRQPGKVARLKKCIYGLKQSPREWYFRLVLFLQPYGFAISAFDPCVLAHDTGKFLIAIYVD